MKFAMLVDDVKPIKSMKHKIKILPAAARTVLAEKVFEKQRFFFTYRYIEVRTITLKNKSMFFPHFYNV